MSFFMKKIIISILIGIFCVSSVRAETLPDQLLSTTPDHAPLVLRGIRLYPDNPYKFDFLIDEGQNKLNKEELREQAKKHINYFLAALTIPEEDLWVNLSPYEKDRIIPNELSLTDMGKDMLSQDYTLKQLLSSLTHPDTKSGKQFWNKVYKKAQSKLGTTNIPIDTYNKIWIIPDKAVVYEEETLAFIGEARLKVLLEEDYLALKNNNPSQTNKISSQTMKDTILPIIEEEVNQGKHFSSLRGVYHSLILATWYKERLYNTPISQSYADKRKIKGIDTISPIAKQNTYNQYLKSFKDGLYNEIRKEYDPYVGKNIKRRYYSGGIQLNFGNAMSSAISYFPITITTQKPLASSAVIAEFRPLTQTESNQSIDKLLKSRGWKGPYPKSLSDICMKIREAIEARNISVLNYYLYDNPRNALVPRLQAKRKEPFNRDKLAAARKLVRIAENVIRIIQQEQLGQALLDENVKGVYRVKERFNSSSSAASSPAQPTGGIDLDGDYLNIDTRRKNSTVGTRFIASSKAEDIAGYTFDILQIREYRP